MPVEFKLTLTREEKEYLKSLVPWSISRRLNHKSDGAPPEPPTELPRQPYGAFVTLTLNGRLRGCIGSLTGRAPLYKTIVDMAQAAAFEDPRFPPLTLNEFEKINTEISILGPIEPCPDPEQIVIGRHGLLIRLGQRQGLLLPQVPVEWKWDRLTFLAQTCRKAGLPDTAWKDPAAELYWFEAEIF